MSIKIHRQYANLVSLSLGCILLPSAINSSYARDAIVNKLIEPLKAVAIIRSRIAESLDIAASAKAEIITGALTANELAAIADMWNAQAEGHGALNKYVKSVQINHDTGEITITFNEATIGAIPPDSTIVFTPYVYTGGDPIQLAEALATGVFGTIDWGCASATSAISSGQNIPAVTMGTLPAKFAPLECR